jgi:hypothetical protein
MQQHLSPQREIGAFLGEEERESSISTIGN